MVTKESLRDKAGQCVGSSAESEVEESSSNRGKRSYSPSGPNKKLCSRSSTHGEELDTDSIGGLSIHDEESSASSSARDVLALFNRKEKARNRETTVLLRVFAQEPQMNLQLQSFWRDFTSTIPVTETTTAEKQ